MVNKHLDKKSPKKIFVKPIVYGNTATKLKVPIIKPQNEPNHNFSWTLYVKPYLNEDMSAFVSKVQFKLDESFDNPVRTVFKPPYEVNETGWGEFDVWVKIYFRDTNEKPVSFYHRINLYPSDFNILVNNLTVAIESYDEIIFPNPSKVMRKYLVSEKLGNYLFPGDHIFNFSQMEKNLVQGLLKAQEKAIKEIAVTSEIIKKKENDIQVLKNALENHLQSNALEVLNVD